MSQYKFKIPVEKRCDCRKRLKWNPLYGRFECEDEENCGKLFIFHQGRLTEVIK